MNRWSKIFLTICFGAISGAALGISVYMRPSEMLCTVASAYSLWILWGVYLWRNR